MSSFYQFAGEHPWLAFFLILAVTHMPVAIIRALKGKDDQ